jgi:hypothetical protein
MTYMYDWILKINLYLAEDGQVYKFNVNYGKRNVEASRQADDTLRASPMEYRWHVTGVEIQNGE